MVTYDFDWRFDYGWVRDGIPWFTYGPDQPNPSNGLIYNQVKLDYVRRKLADVSEEIYLQAIVARLLKPGMSPQEEVETLTRFVQEAMWHNPLEQPVEPDAMKWKDYYAQEKLPRFADISDLSLWPGVITQAHFLLELHEGRCGQQAQVLVRLCQIAGFTARVMQLIHHRVCEVFYAGDWHFSDPNQFKHGVLIRRPDGTLPSTAWLIDPEHVYLTDSLPVDGSLFTHEQSCDTQGTPVTGYVSPSVTSGKVHYYSSYLGAPIEYPPSVPLLQSPQVVGDNVILAWAPSTDLDEETPQYHLDLYRTGESAPLRLWRNLSVTRVVDTGLPPGEYQYSLRAVDRHRQHNPDTWYYPACGSFMIE